MDGMEITQFTYFQQAGGIDLTPISVELTYGLERIAMYLQGVGSVYDLEWAPRRELRRPLPAQRGPVEPPTTSRSPTPTRSSRPSTHHEAECRRCLDADLALPAYDQVLKCSHTFNLLDARGRHQRHRARRVHLAGARAGGPVRPRLPRAGRPRRGRYPGPPMPDLLLEVGCEELPSSPAARSSTRRRGCWPRRSPRRAGGAGRCERVGGAAPLRGAGRAACPPSWRPAPGPCAARRPRAAFGPDGAPTKAGEGFARGQGVAVARPAWSARTTAATLRLRRAARGGPRRPTTWCPRWSRAWSTACASRRRCAGATAPACASRGRCAGSSPSSTSSTVPFELHGLRAGDVSQGHRFLGGPGRDRRSASGYHEALEACGVVADHERRRRADRRRPRRRRRRGGRRVERPGRQARGGRVPGRVAERHHGALRRPPPAAAAARAGDGDAGPPALLPAARRAGAAAARPSWPSRNGDPDARRRHRPRQRGRAGRPAAGRRVQLRPRPRGGPRGARRPPGRDRLPRAPRLDGRQARPPRRRGRRPGRRGRRRRRRGGRRGRGRPPGEGRPGRDAGGRVLRARGLRGRRSTPAARASPTRPSPWRWRSTTCPRGRTRRCRRARPGALVGGAEKFDNLVGAFAVGEAPTGSKDPYGLRRAAAGLVRIALDRDWDVDPCDAAASGVRAAGDAGRRADRGHDGRGTCDQVVPFLFERLALPCSPPRASGPRPCRRRAGASGRRPVHRRPGRGRSRRRAGDAGVRRGLDRGHAPGAHRPQGADRGRAARARRRPGRGGAARRDAEAARRGIDAALEARDLPAALAAAAPLAACGGQRSSRMCWSTPTTPGCGRGATRWCARRRRLLSRVADFERVTEGGGAR